MGPASICFYESCTGQSEGEGCPAFSRGVAGKSTPPVHVGIYVFMLSSPASHGGNHVSTCHTQLSKAMTPRHIVNVFATFPYKNNTIDTQTLLLLPPCLAAVRAQ